MMPHGRNVSQAVRLFYLALYMFFLFVMNRLAFGQWVRIPTQGDH